VPHLQPRAAGLVTPIFGLEGLRVDSAGLVGVRVAISRFSMVIRRSISASIERVVSVVTVWSGWFGSVVTC